MKENSDIMLWLMTSERTLDSFDEILNGLEFIDYRPLPEDITTVKDDWVLFDGDDWMVEFVGGKFIYFILH